MPICRIMKAVSHNRAHNSQLNYVPNVRSIERITQVVIALTSLYHVVTFNQDKVILVCWAASYKHNNGIVSWSVWCLSSVSVAFLLGIMQYFFPVKMVEGPSHFPHPTPFAVGEGEGAAINLTCYASLSSFCVVSN